MHITDKQVKPISDLNLRSSANQNGDFQLFDYNSFIVGLGLYSFSLSMDLVIIDYYHKFFSGKFQQPSFIQIARMYLQPNYGNGLFGKVYLSAEQH